MISFTSVNYYNEWVLFNGKWTIFQLYLSWLEHFTFLWDDGVCSVAWPTYWVEDLCCCFTETCINGVQAYILLHSDILSWLRTGGGHSNHYQRHTRLCHYTFETVANIMYENVKKNVLGTDVLSLRRQVCSSPKAINVYSHEAKYQDFLHDKSVFFL